MEKISDKIAALPQDGKFFSLEFFPPKTVMGSSNLQSRLGRMTQALRPLFVTVTWGAGGSTAAKSLELAEICQRQLGVTTCLHLTCTNMDRSLIDRALDEAKVLGIKNILALRGDPPRNDEYRKDAASADVEAAAEFVWAVDLVRYIRKAHGDYFCIGVAAYPEGHADESYPQRQDPGQDLPYLVEKVQAGADFIVTQLFFDVSAYQRFESMLRGHESGAFKTIPIIPGLMPVQSYQVLQRTTKLSHAKLPPDIERRLQAVKGDDEAVKKIGVEIASEIVEEIASTHSPGPRGFHFYTLNLEKAVSFIVERCNLIPPPGEDDKRDEDEDESALVDSFGEVNIVNGFGDRHQPPRRRESSVNSDPHNRVVVDRRTASTNSNFEASAEEAGIPKGRAVDRATTLAISEGEGSLGREATWDDYPNGRWGDARSPAYGEIDGYGVSLHVSVANAIRLWGHPASEDDITSLFVRHMNDDLEAIPWSEEGLNDESKAIHGELLKLNRRKWWTVASQPAVNGVRSDDAMFGWGPKNGFVFQKAFVEFFIPSSDWEALHRKLQDIEDVSYYAGNSEGEFVCSDADSVNAVTWGAFTGKEIISPTIIEGISFRAWQEEAYDIWREWQRVYAKDSDSAQLLDNIIRDRWLVNVIHHDYIDSDALWRLLTAGD
ncbi:MAG: hypothetical protein M1815_006290 [Lichina confinis]|nr:MAG: hypothetical protein M1815_006290 [Lichina confinis]